MRRRDQRSDDDYKVRRRWQEARGLGYTTDNNVYRPTLNKIWKKHGMKIFVKKRKALKITKGKETVVKIHTGQKEII